MRSGPGYWLELSRGEKDATVDLGFYLPGCPEHNRGANQVCPDCGTALRLAAVYRRSAYIMLERYAALVLKMCPECAEETDGYEGRNGFAAEFTSSADLNENLTELNCLLTESALFRAVPTEEPSDPEAFGAWKAGKACAKLGGRQIAIQQERRLKACGCCGGPTLFVGSIDEQWARDALNFGGGMGYVFGCSAECRPEAAFFYWDCP